LVWAANGFFAAAGAKITDDAGFEFRIILPAGSNRRSAMPRKIGTETARSGEGPQRLSL
jgi:hypothetical protein